MQLTHSIADIYFYAHLILETCVLNEKQVVCFQIGCHGKFVLVRWLYVCTEWVYPAYTPYNCHAITQQGSLTLGIGT